MSTTSQISSPPPVPPGNRWQMPYFNLGWEALIMAALAIYFLAYGLVPYLGGDAIGLVGADEPRYAQVAREMLSYSVRTCAPIKQNHETYLVQQAQLRWCYVAHSVTPILYGHPWLEKPALFYWRAMFSLDEFGVHDWSARLPSTSFAFALITLIYLHMRRFRPGGQLYAALITASCAGIIGFARGASTDMQLAAPFCIGMLGWYAWYETGSKFWLFDLYFFVAAGTLAKGPIAPAMALGIIVLFAGLRREWGILRRTIWLPGIILYLAMVLPWYIAVTKKNPNFLRIFFLEHNLERFATDRFHHHYPVWFYVPVALLALMPWTVLALTSLVDAVQGAVTEWRTRRSQHRYVWMARAGDAFPEFLVVWALLPLIFFSFSGSKLPGYILPSIPPITILTGDYLNRRRGQGLPKWLLLLHAFAVGGMTTFVLLLPQMIATHEHTPPTRAILLASGIGLAVLAVLFFSSLKGTARLRTITLIPVAFLLFFLLHMNGPLLDALYSARPLSNQLAAISAPADTVAVYNTRRDVEYGIAFYRNQRVIDYKMDGVPLSQHLLIARAGSEDALHQVLGQRKLSFVMHSSAQDLDVYWVGSSSGQ